MVADTAKDELVRRRLLINTLSNHLGNVVTLATGFVLTPFILHHLGSKAYGLWILVGSVIAYGGILDLGIAGAVTKYVAEYRERGETVRLQSLVSTALVFYFGVGLVAFFASVVLAPVLPDLFHVSPDERTNATYLVFLMGLGLGISLPCMITGAILRGLQRFEVVNILGVGGALVSALATVIILISGGGLIGMVAVNVPIILLMQIPSIRYIRHLIPELHLTWRGASRAQIRTVVVFSGSLFGLNVAGRLQDGTDQIVIGALLPLSSITPYSLALSLSQLPQILANQFVRVLMPLASQFHAAGDHVRLRTLYLDSTRITLAVLVPVACVLVTLAARILTLWVGSPYGRYAYLVVILTLSGLVITSQFPAGAILQGMARHHLLAALALGSGVANLLLSIILVQKMGLAGVALGTLIPYSIECFGFVLPYAMRTTGVTISSLLMEAVLPPLLPVVPMIAALLLLRPFAVSLPALALIVGSAMVIYYAVYLRLGAKDFEHKMWRELRSDTLEAVMARHRSS